MARPLSDLDDYLDWQDRLENYKASGLSVDAFCLQEGFSKTTFYRWTECLKDGIPKSMLAEEETRKKAESGKAAFVPITLKASPVEIELPNGGVVRLPLGIGQVVLVEVIRAVGAGYLHADGYTGYDAMFLNIDSKVHEVACWAHPRRRFFDAVKNCPREAHGVLEWIRQLYDIEDRARELTVEARQTLRAKEAIPVLDKIESYLAELAPRALPKSN